MCLITYITYVIIIGVIGIGLYQSYKAKNTTRKAAEYGKQNEVKLNQ